MLDLLSANKILLTALRIMVSRSGGAMFLVTSSSLKGLILRILCTTQQNQSILATGKAEWTSDTPTHCTHQLGHRNFFRHKMCLQINKHDAYTAEEITNLSTQCDHQDCFIPAAAPIPIAITSLFFRSFQTFVISCLLRLLLTLGCINFVVICVCTVHKVACYLLNFCSLFSGTLGMTST